MPIYEFECKKCSYVFERLMKIEDGYEDLACPTCGEKDPKKLVTAFRTNLWSAFLDDMEKKVSPNKFK